MSRNRPRNTGILRRPTQAEVMARLLQLRSSLVPATSNAPWQKPPDPTGLDHFVSQLAQGNVRGARFRSPEEFREKNFCPYRHARHWSLLSALWASEAADQAEAIRRKHERGEFLIERIAELRKSIAALFEPPRNGARPKVARPIDQLDFQKPEPAPPARASITDTNADLESSGRIISQLALARSYIGRAEEKLKELNAICKPRRKDADIYTAVFFQSMAECFYHLTGDQLKSATPTFIDFTIEGFLFAGGEVGSEFSGEWLARQAMSALRRREAQTPWDGRERYFDVESGTYRRPGEGPAIKVSAAAIRERNKQRSKAGH